MLPNWESRVWSNCSPLMNIARVAETAEWLIRRTSSEKEAVRALRRSAGRQLTFHMIYFRWREKLWIKQERRSFRVSADDRMCHPSKCLGFPWVRLLVRERRTRHPCWWGGQVRGVDNNEYRNIDHWNELLFALVFNSAAGSVVDNEELKKQWVRRQRERPLKVNSTSFNHISIISSDSAFN